MRLHSLVCFLLCGGMGGAHSARGLRWWLACGMGQNWSALGTVLIGQVRSGQVRSVSAEHFKTKFKFTGTLPLLPCQCCCMVLAHNLT
jgi:hypothetical protein